MNTATSNQLDRPPVWTILLVEDEQSVREITRHVLESAGYIVLEASDPTKAIGLLDRHEGPVHLLLTDMVMPAMSGTELAARLRILRPELITVFMSGYPNNPGGLFSKALPTWFIQKPFTVGVLLSRVAEALAFPYGSGPGAGGNRLAI